MKQKKLKLACVALLSALVLNTGAAFADEVVANDNTSDTAIVDTASSNSNPTNVVSPTAPVDTNSNSNDVPIVEPSKDTASSEKPSTDATQPSKEAPVTEPSKDTASSEKPSTDATQPSTEVPVEKAVKDLVKPSTDATKPSTDATKPSTEVPVVDPSVSPVITDSGLKIVGVENSNPVVANPDGSTTVVAPESIGAKVNPDKTLSVKTESGKMVTLPVTGTEEVISLIASLIGMITMAATVVLRKKMLKDN